MDSYKSDVIFLSIYLQALFFCIYMQIVISRKICLEEVFISFCLSQINIEYALISSPPPMVHMEFHHVYVFIVRLSGYFQGFAVKTNSEYVQVFHFLYVYTYYWLLPSNESPEFY